VIRRVLGTHAAHGLSFTATPAFLIASSGPRYQRSFEQCGDRTAMSIELNATPCGSYALVDAGLN
jgi:hypothetical protein